GHAQAQVHGIGLGHFQLDLEAAQVDHGHQGGIGCDHGAVGDVEGADDAVDRRAHAQFLDPALDIGGEQALALQQLLLGLQAEGDVAAFQFGGGVGVAGADFGTFQGILGAQVVDFGQGAQLVAALGPLQVAQGGQTGDLGLVGVALGQQAGLAGEDLLPGDLGFELGQGGALALQFVLQLGRVQLGQHLALADGGAGLDLQGDRAGGGRIQGGADGGDDPAVDGGIADQGAAADFGKAQPLGGHRAGAAQPAGHQPQQQHHA